MIFSFRTKVTTVAILALVCVAWLSNFFIYRSSAHEQFQQLRDRLKIIAQLAAMQVEGDALARVPLSRAGMESPDYLAIAAQLQEIRGADPSIKYIYTLRKSDKPDTWLFIVDLDPELKRPGRKDVTAYPGDKYFVGRFPEMVSGFNGPSADEEISADEWGITLSSYAPVKDSAGNTVAVLGVDMDARDVRSAQNDVRRRAAWVLLAGVLVSILLGVVLSRRMTHRINTLIRGTREFAQGRFEHHVEVKGHDEITGLATSLNQMADSFQESRKRLEEYFFRMVQSLVSMLEAKDKYTQGHSERVGVYAQRIALKMGLPHEQADMLRKAGELHDIGKIAVHDHILKKEGPLTEEEWHIIRQHPVIGAEALKPVCFDEIIMTSIYSHHERPDGKGYPQKLKGDKISVYAQIIAVADAYDAMTTSRPYRQAMPKAAAIEEIRRNKETQFRPDIADAFIRILEEER